MPLASFGGERQQTAWKSNIAKLEAFGKRFHEAGITFAYHNHEFEFEVEMDGKYALDVLYEKVAPEYLQVEMDIGWVQYAGVEPLSYIAKYADRLPLLHLKDYRAGKKGEQIDTVELGRGDLPLLPIIDAASKASVEWLIVEQDVCERPPLAAVEESMEWLKRNYLK